MQIPARPAFEVLLRTRRPAPLAPLWKDRQALLVRDDEGGEPVLQSVVFIILFYFIFPTYLHRPRKHDVEVMCRILLNKSPPSVYEISLWQTENAICYNPTRPLDLNLVTQTDFRVRDNGVVPVHFPPFDFPCFLPSCSSSIK